MPQFSLMKKKKASMKSGQNNRTLPPQRHVRPSDLSDRCCRMIEREWDMGRVGFERSRLMTYPTKSLGMGFR